MKEVKCNRCGHVWKTKSTLIFVSCPSCMQKVQLKIVEKVNNTQADIVIKEESKSSVSQEKYIQKAQ